jgi:GNAT superfamily N-acetyltransferase
VSYSTEHVWQLHKQAEGERQTVGFTPMRLPRPVTLRDPFWGQRQLTTGSSEGSLLVSETAGGLVGFAVLMAEPVRDIDLMPMLAVVARARRQGIGRSLLAAAVRTAQERGRRALCSTVQARNHPGIRLLGAGGFAFAGHDELYYPSNDVALFFTHRLRAS